MILGRSDPLYDPFHDTPFQQWAHNRFQAYSNVEKLITETKRLIAHRGNNVAGIFDQPSYHWVQLALLGSRLCESFHYLAVTVPFTILVKPRKRRSIEVLCNVWQNSRRLPTRLKLSWYTSISRHNFRQFSFSHHVKWRLPELCTVAVKRFSNII